VLLIGHGTSLDGDEAKFNLVGPDFERQRMERAAAAACLGGSLFVDHHGRQLFHFCGSLAGRGRVVLTSTERRPPQQFETVFPRVLHQGVRRPRRPISIGNNRVSMWEAFTYASAGSAAVVSSRKGQLPTERSLLDDTGAGGRPGSAETRGTDGAMGPHHPILEPEAVLALPSDTAVASLMRRRAELEKSARRTEGAQGSRCRPTATDADLEKLLVEIGPASPRRSRAKS